MTLDDIARKLDTIDTRLSTLERKVDDGFSASEKSLLLNVANLESKMEDGFNASKVRDEELHRLTRFGLEADEIIADSINRRLDESNRKHDQQISLLKDVIRQNVTKR
jgi:hypothetical protein